MSNTFADVFQNGTLGNEFMEVNINKNGSLTIKERNTGAIFEELNVYEESGNAGDEYDFSPPRKDVIITTKGSIPEISVVHNGNLCDG
ncbi:hypothetical protein NDK43_30850 [Neobacillus pocheonensis]|uniref:Uncharacterized protein n=1 Tax=Neobacillus pocheonensis TaxID=363869 RepID=A0ABT0WK23_9BACI|nr:hypothetical protein [Neobacillus pocheonensis]